MVTTTDHEAVRTSGLRVVFGGVTAVNALDLVVAPGDAVALVGRNGAGKSTTLRVLAGVLPPTSGSAWICGFDVTTHASQAKHRLGYCPDVGGLVPRATPWEHLQLAARLREMDDTWTHRATTLLKEFDLDGVADRVAAGFSHGMGRRLSVVLAAFHRPPVLLLDEPFDGVDPLGVDATLATVSELRRAGTAVLISTHLVDLAAEACDTAVVMVDGTAAARVDARDLTGVEGRSRYRAILAGGSP